MGKNVLAAILLSATMHAGAFHYWAGAGNAPAAPVQSGDAEVSVRFVVLEPQPVTSAPSVASTAEPPVAPERVPIPPVPSKPARIVQPASESRFALKPPAEPTSPVEPLPAIEPEPPSERSRLQRSAGVDKPPTHDGRLAVAYPRSCVRQGHGGTVLVRIKIRMDGTCGAATIVQGTGCERLNGAVLEAVRRKRFTPATKNGRPLAATMTWTIRLQVAD